MSVTRQKFRMTLAALTASVVFVFALGQTASAESQPQSGGVTVTPARIQLTLGKGQTSATTPITVRNNSGQSMHFMSEFKAVTLTAKGALVPSTVLSGDIASALTSDLSDFQVDPGESVVLTIRLQDSKALAPGGQYASLFISQIADSGNGLAITPAVSVSLFVLKEDGAARSLSATSVASDGSVFYLPKTVRVDFSAAGNVALVPRASVVLSDPKGKLLATGALNAESLLLQPKGSLRLQSQLASLDKSYWPGKYRLLVTYRYDGTDQVQTVSQYFWHFPPVTIGLILLMVFLLCGCGLVIAKLIRWYRHRAKRPKDHKQTSLNAKKPRRIMDVLPKTKPTPDDQK